MIENLNQAFRDEAEDALNRVEETALTLSNDEDVNNVFRAFHTIKGSGGMFGFTGIAAFTHHIENLLDRVRSHEIPITEDLSDIILGAADHIRLLLAEAFGGPAVDEAAQAVLLAKVARLTSGSGDGEKRVDSPSSDSGQQPAWRIQFRPDPGILQRGGEPALLLRDLQQLGECTIEGHVEELPPLEDLEPDRCYAWWTIDLKANLTQGQIEDIFVFEREGSELTIEPVGSVPEAVQAAQKQQPAEGNTVAAPRAQAPQGESRGARPFSKAGSFGGAGGRIGDEPIPACECGGAFPFG